MIYMLQQSMYHFYYVCFDYVANFLLLFFWLFFIQMMLLFCIPTLMSANQITKLVFLGTGPSSGVPNLHCLTTKKCKNCLNPKNKRTNVSLLIETKCSKILIDCTKDFYSQYTDYIMRKINDEREHCNKKYSKINSLYLDNIDTASTKEQIIDSENIDTNLSILLTHEHADAILGLDYIRQMTPRCSITKIYGDKKTSEYLKAHFSYLFRKSNQNTTCNGALEYNIIENNKKLYIDGLEILSLHVEHGTNCVALSFFLQNKILYVSDCSNFDTIDIFYVDILIVECTTFDKFAYGHSNFTDVLRLIERIKPKETFLIGMSHTIDYDEMNVELQKISYNIKIAYDGLEIRF